MVFLMLLLPAIILLLVTSDKPKPVYKRGKIYSVVLLDKNGKRIKSYTYIR